MEHIFSLILLLLAQFLGVTVLPADEVAPSEPVTARVVQVTDGDTIVVEIDGREEKVRYIGIDTPEPYRDGAPACYSKEATAKNKALVAGREVRLVADAEDRDRYGRLLRYVYVEDQMLNKLLVEEGYATTLTIKPNTAFALEFKTLEADARKNQLGLWGACVD